jgi:hypothetical protein
MITVTNLSDVVITSSSTDFEFTIAPGFIYTNVGTNVVCDMNVDVRFSYPVPMWVASSTSMGSEIIRVANGSTFEVKDKLASDLLDNVSLMITDPMKMRIKFAQNVPVFVKVPQADDNRVWFDYDYNTDGASVDARQWVPAYTGTDSNRPGRPVGLIGPQHGFLDCVKKEGSIVVLSATASSWKVVPPGPSEFHPMVHV